MYQPPLYERKINPNTGRSFKKDRPYNTIMKKILDSHYRHLSQFIDGLPRGLFDSGGELLYDGRNTVKAFDVDGHRLVVKRFKVPHLFNRVMYTFFRGTKARRAYRNARWLRGKYGVGTPREIAWIEDKKRGLVTHSYLVTEYTDYKPLGELLKEEKVLQVVGVNALVSFIVGLHKKGIRHNDLNSTNVLYKVREGVEFEFQLIDINRMNFGRMSRRACISNLTRICEEPRLIYYISQKYAEHRGWDRNYSLSLLAFYRGKYENRKKNSARLKKIFHM